MADSEIKWEAPEFEERPKSVGWYWMSILIATAILGIAVWQKNFLFGVFIVVAELLILVWAGRTPPLVSFSLTEKELEVGEAKTHLLKDIRTFSVDEETLDPRWPDLILYFHGYFRPPLRVKVPKRELTRIREMLGTKVTEVEFEASLIDSLERWLRF